MFFAADDIRAGFLRFSQLVAGGDDQNFFRFAEPVRQHHRTADHLVGMFGIDTEPHVQFDGLVEFCELYFLYEWDSLIEAIRAGFYLFGRSFELLTDFGHVSSLVQTAEP